MPERHLLLTDVTFGALGVPAPLVAALKADGKETAFPIQAQTLRDSLAGRDILGRGRTGSGKTLAFSLPMVARLGAAGQRGSQPGRPRGLVLAPTRELANQIFEVLKPLARAYGLSVATVYGGVPQNKQVQAFRNGVDIVVACPGRLEDLIKQNHVRLDAVQVSVLDEADHMADLGFLPCVNRILAATPAGGQRMLFSATLDNEVNAIVKRFMHEAVLHAVDEELGQVAEMSHHIFHVDGADAKRDVIHALASGTGRRILFMRTKHHAKKLAKHLSEQGIPAVDLHGNLSQGARDRNLAAFGSGSVRVLVATDVAARGVHVDDVELVVHVDPPVEHKAYLHRSGRTARAGSAGDVVTLVLPEQRRDTTQLFRKASITAQPQHVTAHSPEVSALVGERAAFVPYVARAEEPQRSRTRAPRAAESSYSDRAARAASGASSREPRPFTGARTERPANRNRRGGPSGGRRRAA